MKIDEIIDFLETDCVSATFSKLGLVFFSLRKDQGELNINFRELTIDQAKEAQVQNLIKETINFLESGKHNMPLDLSAFTSFQQNVFEIVKNIEPGKVYTYKEVAELMQNPGAARAVGSAIAKNPVSFFLPTHRVLPQKGIGICRSGAGHLREKLLEHEGHNLEKLRGNYTCKNKKCIGHF